MKLFSRYILIIVIVIVIGYFLGNYALTRVSHKYVSELKANLEARGLFFEELSYKDITIRSLRSISIHNVDLTFTLDKEIYGTKSFHSSFQAEEIILNLVSLGDAEVTFSLNNFSLRIEPSEPTKQKTFGEFDEANFSCAIPINIRNPEESGKLILLQIESLFQQNRATGLSLTGLANIHISNEQVQLGVKTVSKMDTVYLQFEHADILRAAKIFDIELADKEAKVIATHPSLVPEMIRITRDAKHKASAYRSKNKQFPEDAFRHIYWSYHLTKVLGPVLAKQITDAHETTPGNTTKERAMDYHNNEFARDLAENQLSEEQLLNLVLTSKSIIRFPAEVGEQVAK